MNVIIEPLSEQAWTRVETRLMERLRNDISREPATQRSPLPWPCELIRAVISMRYRIGSWLALITDYRRSRAPTDSAPQGGDHCRAGSVTGVRLALPFR